MESNSSNFVCLYFTFHCLHVYINFIFFDKST